MLGIMGNRIVLVAILALGTSAVIASAGDVCVRNADDRVLLFAAEVRDGDRILSPLPPGGLLCAEGPERAGGVVSVFENIEEAEGCSRLVSPPGGTRILERYVSFDRCAWDDNAG